MLSKGTGAADKHDKKANHRVECSQVHSQLDDDSLDIEIVEEDDDSFYVQVEMDKN